MSDACWLVFMQYSTASEGRREGMTSAEESCTRRPACAATHPHATWRPARARGQPSPHPCTAAAGSPAQSRGRHRALHRVPECAGERMARELGGRAASAKRKVCPLAAGRMAWAEAAAAHVLAKSHLWAMHAVGNAEESRGAASRCGRRHGSVGLGVLACAEQIDVQHPDVYCNPLRPMRWHSKRVGLGTRTTGTGPLAINSRCVLQCGSQCKLSTDDRLRAARALLS